MIIPILISGGLFHPTDDKQEIAFRYAIEKINSDRSILPRSKLQAQIEKIPPQDSFHASKKGMSVFLLILLSMLKNSVLKQSLKKFSKQEMLNYCEGH